MNCGAGGQAGVLPDCLRIARRPNPERAYGCKIRVSTKTHPMATATAAHIHPVGLCFRFRGRRPAPPKR